MDIFVGRDGVMDDLLAMLAEVQDGHVVELTGAWGIGKTVVLDQLAASARESQDVTVRSIDMSGREIGRGYSTFGENASWPMLHETLKRSRELMREFVGTLGDPAAFGKFKGRVTKHRQEQLQAGSGDPGPEPSVGRRQRIAGAGRLSATTIEELRAEQDALDDDFVSGWNLWVPSRRRVLVTVDNFEIVADDEIGHWFVRTALRLHNTLVIIARQADESLVLSSSSRFHRRTLTYFTTDDVAAYLNRLFGGATKKGVAAVVHEFTGGHPGGVGLAAQLVAQLGAATLDATDLRDRLARLPSKPRKKWVGLVSDIIDNTDDALLRQAVDVASLVSSFDRPLLAELMDLESDDEQLGRVIRRLASLGLVEEVPESEAQRGSWQRLRGFIRRPLAEAVDRELASAVHERAARRYYEIVRELDGEASFTFVSGFRYEDATWQFAKREWLRHSAQLTDDRELTRIRFLNVFLEAFWWWGCYHPFELNRQMLEDWQQAITTSPHPNPVVQADDETLAEAMAAFLDSYPTGHVKASTEWPTVRHALDLMEALCDLGVSGTLRPSEEKVEESAKLEALLHIFQGHTWRYGDPSRTRADEHFAAALAYFRSQDDDWYTAWLLFEQADLALARGTVEDALALLPLAAEALRRDQAESGSCDHELLANLFRVRADGAWMRGDVTAALHDYRRAVRHAYHQTNSPRPPDPYTRQFYAEITLRAAQRLVELAGRATSAEALPAAAVVCDDAMEPAEPASPDELATALASADVDRVAAASFPAGPAETELSVRGSTFRIRWRRARPSDEVTNADVELLLGQPTGVGGDLGAP